jgi:uncharacterized protein YegP (UPF0339 family)
MERAAEFKVLKNQDGNYYWHLEIGGNRLVAWSGHVYASKELCVDDLHWIRGNAPAIPAWDYTGEAL